MAYTTLSDDVHNVLKEYIAAIGAKDADIFSLYDSNIHLRGLLEEAVRRTQLIEEELQQEHRKVQLHEAKIESITEEKTKLESERDQWLEFSNAIKILFADMPSNSVKDILGRITEMQHNESILAMQKEKSETYCQKMEDLLVRELENSEQYCREVITNLYDDVINKVVKEYSIMLSNETTTLQLLELEKTTQLEQLAHVLQQMEFEVYRRKAALKSARRKIDAAESKVMYVSQDLERTRNEMKRMVEYFNFYIEKVESLTTLLTSRAVEAESKWMETLLDLKCAHIAESIKYTQEFDERTKNYKETIAVLEQKGKEHTYTLCTLRTSIAAKDELVKKYKESNDELRRAKEQTCELLQRQRSLAAKREAMLRKSKDVEQKQLAKLEQESKKERETHATEMHELRTTIEECKLKNHSLEECNHQLLNELHKAQGTVREIERRLEAMQQLEEHQCNVLELLSELKIEYECKVKELRCEYDAKLEHGAKELENAESRFNVQLQAKEEEVTHVQTEWNKKYNTLQVNANDEIREWVEIAEKWKADAHFLDEELHKEREVRELLESQQCNESQLLRHILDTPPCTNKFITQA